MHYGSLREPGVSRGMTVRAQGSRVRAYQSIGGMLDLMIAVAGNPARESGGSEHIFVRAGREQLRLEYVAVRADVGDVGNPRGCCAVIAMAGGARWVRLNHRALP